MRRERAQHVRSLATERGHRGRGRFQPFLVPKPFARGVQKHPRPERLRQEERVAGPGAALRPVAGRVHRADDREAVLRLIVAEDRSECLVGQALGEGGDREREQRQPTHREDVVEGVGRRDPAEERGVVDEWREEVEREDERALFIELVDDCIVRG